MIVHLHIPKNGDSTFNDTLRRHFGAGYVWLWFERPENFLNKAELTEFITRNRNAQAIASHRFRYPCPDLPGLRYDYIVFLRHPINRWKII